jgi:hypothetical protein
MVYKLGNYKDMEQLPPLDEKTEEILYTYTSALTYQYGEGRNVDEDDGGVVFYAPPGTDCEEIKACFDYTKHTPEYADRYGNICATMYVTTHNEYAVVIVMSIVDAPIEITKEFVEGY